MPLSRPPVSLIVVNWNGRHHLEPCLDSLRALEYPEGHLEVLVADNGSTDGSLELLRDRYPEVRVLPLGHNHGFAAANNLAAEQARGEWVGFLNNDMRVEPGWLGALTDGRERHPEAACLASRILNWDGSAIDFVGGGANYQGHGFQHDHGAPSSAHDVERRLLFPCGGAMLARRERFREMGGFDADFFAYFEDVDLGWRLNLLGHDTWYVPQATARHRHHGTSRNLDYHRVRVLFERNALMTIYKVLEPETLARVLPAALLLMNERALSISPVDESEFALAGDATGRARHRSRPEPGAADDDAAEPGEPVGARARRVLATEGPAAAAVKTARLLRYHAVRRSRDAARRRLAGRDVFLHAVSVSHWVAMRQFANELDRLNSKRAWLQERRRRSDREIAPLLDDPMYANHDDPAYLDLYRFVTRELGIDRIFDAAAGGPR